jgi:hypothetical protein
MKLASHEQQLERQPSTRLIETPQRKHQSARLAIGGLMRRPAMAEQSAMTRAAEAVAPKKVNQLEAIIEDSFSLEQSP